MCVCVCVREGASERASARVCVREASSLRFSFSSVSSSNGRTCVREKLKARGSVCARIFKCFAPCFALCFCCECERQTLVPLLLRRPLVSRRRKTMNLSTRNPHTAQNKYTHAHTRSKQIKRRWLAVRMRGEDTT